MENKNSKNEKQKRSKAAKIVLWSILGCVGVMLIIILVNLIIGMAGGTGTQDGSILGLGFSSLFAILGFLLVALILAWLLTEPSFKKKEEVVVVDDRYSSYVKKAKTPRPLADKTGVKPVEDKTVDNTEKADEAPAKEEKTVETVAAEPVKEEETVDETPKKKVTPTSEPSNDEAKVAVAEATETVFVRYRRSYMSRLIQSDDDIKSYYTDIKNKLLSYNGVHDRVSWDFESFNAGRKKLAKINVKGRTLTVNLALDPKTVDAKYYATDVSDKAKLSDVPTLMKVKSGRSVKYTLELIEKMMATEEIPVSAVPSKKTFDIAYRDNETLVKEGYIKAMYDKDIDPDGNYIEQEIDIEDFLKK